MSDRKMRDKILLATLPHVVFDGWSDKSLRAGIADAGLKRSHADAVFPNGMAGVVAHFSDWADRCMLDALEKHASQGVRDTVILAVRLRLEALAPHQEAVRRALSYLSLPGNARGALRATYRTVNAIWFAAGDRSTDMNFYTKRALLTPVYTATVLYWMADESEDFKDTWGFLERRLDGVLKLPRLLKANPLATLRARARSGFRPFGNPGEPRPSREQPAD